ncbi:winged helix-turn-helix transcriptional regulator [Leptolyngbya sp. AN02str]|uniref:winged helix-turn-helix transcriptional regulator n=1 Tax=Leptolyngbya sp. AN02str TaxID=3423363 RepID=UPI003D317AD5
MASSKHVSPCPVGKLMDVLSGPWTMYLLWVLSTQGPTRFGALKRRIEGISTKMLTERLRMLEHEGIVYRHYEPTVPPQVTYGLTERGHELFGVLDQLNDLAVRWYGDQNAASKAS